MKLGDYQRIRIGLYHDEIRGCLDELERSDFVRRLWRQDYTLWKDKSDDIADRLGWLNSPGKMKQAVARLRTFAEGVRAEHCKRVLMLGMGGSSLAPEMFSRIFGVREGCCDIAVLDSTDPAAVSSCAENFASDDSLYIVSSKSGTTTETLALFRYFYNRVAPGRTPQEAGRRFLAITDPNSHLAQLADQYNFLKRFLNDSSIGGRYSALSYFGLVPAVLLGVDIERLLAEALKMGELCRLEDYRLEGANHGLVLGAFLGGLARKGRDKVTFFISPLLESFGGWLEQLVAESTGKEGKGILPVVGEAPGEVADYADDRVFISIRLENEPSCDSLLKALQEAGHPVISLVLRNIYDIGAHIFLWEVATAVAGHILRINPFDQPDVESSKKITRDMINGYLQTGLLPNEKSALSEGEIVVCGDTTECSAGDVLRAFLDQTFAGSYVALQAYLQPLSETSEMLAALRLKIRDRYKVATSAAYGPRFLHSTGQLHKGDGGKGFFIQLTADDRLDVPIPDDAGREGSSLTFGVLKMAQAAGDRRALLNAGRRVIRFHFTKDVLNGLRLITESLI